MEGFDTLDLLEKILSQLSATVICVTELEANNLGVFLCELFSMIVSWYDSSSTRFDKSWTNKNVTHGHFKKKIQKLHDSFANILSECLKENCPYMYVVFEREAHNLNHFHIFTFSCFNYVKEYHSHCLLMPQRNYSKSNVRMQTQL